MKILLTLTIIMAATLAGCEAMDNAAATVEQHAEQIESVTDTVKVVGQVLDPVTGGTSGIATEMIALAVAGIVGGFGYYQKRRRGEAEAVVKAADRSPDSPPIIEQVKARPAAAKAAERITA